MAHKGMLCVLTNACDMKECEAPESKRTVAGVELTSNVPSMTSGFSSTVSIETEGQWRSKGGVCETEVQEAKAASEKVLNL